MSNLKELTWEHHKNAERQAFVKEMFAKEPQISHKRYATYLWNQFPGYDVLEALAMMHGLFDDIPEIRRAPSIMEDFLELWDDNEPMPTALPVVDEYLKYLKSISNDKSKLMAHVYVRHMGDLSGGQMIAKRVPGTGKFYQFNGDTEEIKNRIRLKLDDSMADEAKVCFDFATKMFQQLGEANES